MTSVCFGPQRLLYVRAHKKPAWTTALFTMNRADVNRARPPVKIMPGRLSLETILWINFDVSALAIFKRGLF